MFSCHTLCWVELTLFSLLLCPFLPPPTPLKESKKGSWKFCIFFPLSKFYPKFQVQGSTPPEYLPDPNTQGWATLPFPMTPCAYSCQNKYNAEWGFLLLRFSPGKDFVSHLCVLNFQPLSRGKIFGVILDFSRPPSSVCRTSLPLTTRMPATLVQPCHPSRGLGLHFQGDHRELHITIGLMKSDCEHDASWISKA